MVSTIVMAAVDVRGERRGGEVARWAEIGEDDILSDPAWISIGQGDICEL